MDRKDLFPTPVWVTTLDVTEKETQQVIDFCLHVSASNAGIKKSNLGGWHSPIIDFSEITSTPLQNYFHRIQSYLDQCVLELGIDRYITPTGIWFIKNSYNHSNYVHIHPGSFLSGCFYLTDNNSEIAFQRPYDVNAYWQADGGSNHNTPLTIRGATYKPQKNQLIIFPSWVEHEVYPNQNHSDRISVAFNTVLGRLKSSN